MNVWIYISIGFIALFIDLVMIMLMPNGKKKIFEQFLLGEFIISLIVDILLWPLMIVCSAFIICRHIYSNKDE